MRDVGAGSHRYWQLVAGYVVVLLTTQSFMGLGIDKFKELWGLEALEYTAYFFVGVGAAPVLWFGAKLWRRCTVAERLWIAVALAIYLAGTLSARNPQERLHYLGYGLLAVLLYIGFSGRRAAVDAAADSNPVGAAMLYAVLPALLLGAAVGMSDELLQILWPRRYFDWADVMINVLSVGLGLLVAIPLWNAWGRAG